MAKVIDAQIWELGFNLISPFDKYKDKILPLLPSKREQRIRFIITGVNTAIANAIRRTTISELKAKAFTFSISEIKTNNKEIILQELFDRISLLPVDQDTPLDTTYSLAVKHSDTDQEYKVYYSSDLVQIGGVKLKQLPFSNMYRLAELRPGQYLEIPKISIEEGYCFQENGAKFSITSNFKYDARDFLAVKFLNERGNIIDKMVKRDDLIELIRKHKISTGDKVLSELVNLNKKAAGVYISKILVIPNKNYHKQIKGNVQKQITGFNLVIENKKEAEKVGREADDLFLKEYLSEEANPSEYYMEFTTHGTVDPVALLEMTCDNLIERLGRLAVEENLYINKDNEKTQIVIRGEDHTIGNLLTKTIYELDPSIGLINSNLEHPQIRLITINIKHANPLKIFGDAVKKLINDFGHIKSQFGGVVRHKDPEFL